MTMKISLVTLIFSITFFAIEGDASLFETGIFRANQTITMSSAALESRVTQRIQPVIPAGCRCTGAITAYITVNDEGKVEKITTSKGHPLLRLSVIKALRKWTFEPLEKNGKKVCFKGQLTFSF
jgi:outer membrane biosynthesis protein TonB